MIDALTLLEITQIDRWLDQPTAFEYSDQPLAQDWARVAKISEEQGEAIAELILWTGQNPRKGQDPKARARLLSELCDVVLTAVLAIQHFTKDAEVTRNMIRKQFHKAYERMNENIKDAHHVNEPNTPTFRFKD